RLGTILAHVGLLDRAREMYERGRVFDPKKAVSHSIVQVYMWNQEYDAARRQIAAWKAASPGNKYPLYFAPQPAMMSAMMSATMTAMTTATTTGEWDEAEALLEEAMHALPDEPMIVSLQGLYFALRGDEPRALDMMARANASPKSFGHAHHSY